jgi:hypothetical protein
VTGIFSDGPHRRDVLRMELDEVEGDSGSPIVDPGGEVVGVLFGGGDPGEDSFATDVTALTKMVADPAIGDGTDRCAVSRFRIIAGD